MTEPVKSKDIPNNRKKLTWTAMALMVIVTLILMTPIVEIARITALLPVLQTFYFTMSSIVGTFMGFQFWANKEK